MTQADVIIVGAGIVGLATGWQILQRSPKTNLIILEKDEAIALHQSSHNSGVLHTGIYYKPGSLKAENCFAGRRAMINFCAEHKIHYDICGKVIVATNPNQLPALKNILANGRANGVKCALIDRQQLHQIEPHVKGVAAIHVPEAGIVHYPDVCQKLAELIQSAGGKIICNQKVEKVENQPNKVVIKTNISSYKTNQLITCAGLYSDKVTALTGQKSPAKIVPFRGEYYQLKPSAEKRCNGLIYPVPDPSFPFLGVHFTKMAFGGVTCGPNAVLAFRREGYTKQSFNLPELMESLTYSGFIKLAAKHWTTGFGEMWRSINKNAFVKALQQLIPDIKKDDLIPYPAGVRAQAMLPNGSMVDDFLILEKNNIINVCNAPSPAATSALNIGNLLTEKMFNNKIT